MAGQPNASQPIDLWLLFNVTNLQASEPGSAPTPAIIVPSASPFSLIATFEGSGIIWGWLTNMGIQYDVKFFAEGIGFAAPDFDLGTQSGNLISGQAIYDVTFDVPAGITTSGIYEITCQVTFPLCPGMSGHPEPALWFEVQ